MKFCLVEVSSRSDIRNYVKTFPVLQVSSLTLGGHGHLDIPEEPEMLSDGREHPSEASVIVSSRYDIGNHVQFPHVLQFTFWILGGHGHS